MHSSYANMFNIQSATLLNISFKGPLWKKKKKKMFTIASNTVQYPTVYHSQNKTKTLIIFQIAY